MALQLQASVSEPALASPAASRLAFMRPRFLRPDPVLVQMPFLFWLLDILRPSTAVQIGLGAGTGYFGLCQAIDRFGPNGTMSCLGIALPHENGEGGVPTDLAAYNAQHYREFSTLVYEDAAAAAGRVPVGSLDLLIVSSSVAEPAEALGEVWMPRLSARGVIVLHGAATQMSALKDDRLVIELVEGEGLSAILYGPAQDERLARIAALLPGTSGHVEAWQTLGQLGRAIGIEAEAEARETALAEARAALKAAEGRASSAETARREALAGWAERHRRAAELEARLFDVQSHVGAPEAEADGAANRVVALEAEVAALRASEATRFDELATLARMIEESTADPASEAASDADPRLPTEPGASAGALKAQIAARDARIRDLSDQISALKRSARDAVRRRDAMLSSTSWRLTGPLRRVSLALRRKR